MKAISILENHGNVLFEQLCKKHTKVTFTLYNFPKNSTHAIHIHEYGDTSDGCKSLGTHYNPKNKNHGTIFDPERERHAGDLINNFYTDKNGKYTLSYVDELSVKDILGRSVVVHEGQDDLGLGGNKESLISGNAGNRIACGIIGLKK